MSRLFVISFLLSILIISAQALHPPSYLKPCSRSDPNLNECAAKHGREAIPSIIKGDKQFRIPNMQPLIIPQIDIESGPSLKMQFNEAKIYGLESMEIKKMSIDVKNQTATIYLYAPLINLKCNYSIEGKILVLPITGKGPANFSFVDGDYAFTFNWELKKKKDGKVYADITSHKMEVATKRDYFHLENLFNGNKLLGEQMNKFLDENWKDVHDEVAPSVTDVVGQIAVSIAGSVYEKIPYDELLLP